MHDHVLGLQVQHSKVGRGSSKSDFGSRGARQKSSSERVRGRGFGTVVHDSSSFLISKVLVQCVPVSTRRLSPQGGSMLAGSSLSPLISTMFSFSLPCRLGKIGGRGRGDH